MAFRIKNDFVWILRAVLDSGKLNLKSFYP